MEIEIQKAFRPTKRSTIDCGKGLTEQSHKNETDMNFILRDYQRTGLIKHAKNHEGKYDDITMQDFQSAMYIVAQGKTMFELLPANIRKEFNQDPGQFLSFVQNPDNAKRMESMGILKGNDGIDINGAATGAPVEQPLPEGARQPNENSNASSGAQE